ncbi:hypothetical protein [Lysinibacillus sp. NPDC059133]|uniref:hypothetical protein n=1 Tax=Lysinibacillus sp. NPDC059133 TaxID=3346737 RepID=UPI0036CC2825
MTHSNEEVTFQEFVLFIKIYSKQLEENINIYLHLEPSISESDRKRTMMLLDSFILLLTHIDIEDINEEYGGYLDTWLQSQFSIIDMRCFNLFQLILEKSLITFMIQQKHSRMNAIVMFLLSMFTYLVQSYNKYEEGHKKKSESHESLELKNLLLLDQLNKLLIRCSGYQDLASIL